MLFAFVILQSVSARGWISRGYARNCFTSDTCCLDGGGRFLKARYLVNERRRWPEISDFAIATPTYNGFEFNCLTTEDGIPDPPRWFKHYYATCPSYTSRRIVDNVNTYNMTRLARKAYCVTPLEENHQAVAPSSMYCLHLPRMQTRKGALAWVTRLEYADDPGLIFLTTTVTSISLRLVETKLPGESSLETIEEWFKSSLEWHPRAWHKGDLYQACIINNPLEIVTLNVAIVDTWYVD